MSIDLNTCTKACHGCIKKYAKKHSLKKGDSFKLVCSGIPKEYIPDSIASSLGVDPTMAIAMYDPVTWAAKMLDWHCIDPDGSVWKRKTEDGSIGEMPEYDEELAKTGKSIFHRPYQAEMMRCTSLNKAFRIGRQAGKCLVSGTQIHMADGTFKSIEDIKDEDLVLSLSDYDIVASKAYLTCNGTKETALLNLGDGRRINGSLNHPFLVRKKIGREKHGTRKSIFLEEWIELGELKKGDLVAVPRKTPEGRETVGSDPVARAKLSLLGLLLSDGNITGRNCRFSNQNQEILQHLNTQAQRMGCHVHHYDCDKEHDYHIRGNGSGKPHPVKRWLKDIGVDGLDSHQKFIPDDYMKLQNQDLKHILSSMYGCDGWASVSKGGKPEIGYCTVSEKLASQVVALLARFGIYASMRRKVTMFNGKEHLSQQVIISRQRDILNFIENIGLLGKSIAMENVKCATARRKNSPKTDAHEEQDVVFVPVSKVTSTGKKMTWDLSVPEQKTFIADNIITHNTETLCIVILHRIFTHNSFPAVVIAPFQSQVDLIFTRLVNLVKSNPVLNNSVKRSVKAPNYMLELHNGSKVTGFTAGTRSGQDAGASRGQSAKMLVFDEADYLSSGDIDAALAIVTNFQDATVWMSSTPTGRREAFYDTCGSKLFREFHYTSFVNPNFTEQKDALYRSRLTEAGYKHEVMAEFGEQEEGVYQVKYVEAAQAEYEYGDYKYNPTWTYMIGVDWNDIKIGTTVAVIGFNPNDNYFYLVDKAIVSRSQWNQLAACEQIKDYNRLWNPSAIYVDQGFGGTQVEVLQEYGSRMLAKLGPNHPDSRLRKIVKPYDFGGKVEIRDLFTGQPIKKPSKPFLVENSVRRFENMAFKYPVGDESYTAQLLGYIIDRVSVSGAPVYKAQNEAAGDHFLDAVNLAFVAFTFEKTKFGKPTYSTQIAFAGKFGEGFSGSIKTMSHAAKEHKPQQGRADLMQDETHLLQPQHGDLPAANTAVESTTRLWSWPGWGTDAPKPNPASINQKWKAAQQGPRRKRPRRAKF